MNIQHHVPGKALQLRLVVGGLLASIIIGVASAQTTANITLNSKGLASLTAANAGADGHNFVNTAGSRGEFRAGITMRRPDGTTYAITHFNTASYTQTMDAANGVLTRTFTGLARIEVRYGVQGNQVRFYLKATNLHPTDKLDSFNATLVNLLFPGGLSPAGWLDSQPPRADNVLDPAAHLADYGTGKLCVYTDGLLPAGLRFGSKHFSGFEVQLGPYADGVLPGGVLEHCVILAFGTTESSRLTLAGDMLRNWREANPTSALWLDRRPIGATFLAGSNWTTPANPRGWFSGTAVVDTATGQMSPSGMAAFRQALLTRADNEIGILSNVGAQGILIWDCEGSRHGHPITYIGDPRLLGQIAPEMEYRPSPSALPTIDAYIKKLKEAGFKVGMTLRPQVPMLGTVRADGTLVTDQIKVPTQQEAFHLLKAKVDYAVSRWGVSFIYVDTDIIGTGGIATGGSGFIAPWVYDSLTQHHPEVVFFPELNGATQLGAYAGRYKELDLALPRTSDSIREVYPNAFSLINVMDGDFSGRRDDILLGAKRGDFLLFRGWFADSRNPLVKDVYLQAKSENSPPTASLVATPLEGEDGMVRLDALGSTDDGSIAAYRWTLGDGTEPFMTGAEVIHHQFSSLGNYAISLEVQDNFGLVSPAVRRMVSALPVGGASATSLSAATGDLVLGSDVASYGGIFDQGSAALGTSGTSVRIFEDAAKSFPLVYNVNAQTVIKTDVNIVNGGTGVGIGLDENDNPTDAARVFQIGGDETLTPGIDIRPQVDSGLQTLIIPVGSYYTGVMSRLVLLGKGSGADTTFSNIQIYDEVPEQSYREAVMADNPVVFFEFEEPAGRTSVVDSVSGRTATLNNRGQKTGEAGLAQSSAISIAQHGVWRVEDSDNLIRRATGTWEVWIKFSANSAQEDIFEIGGGEHTTGLTVRGGGGVPFALRTTSTASVGPIAEVNRWYHLVVTHNGSTVKFYIDGVLMRTVTQTRTITTTAPVRIALPSKSATAKRFFDNFAVYASPLPPAKIEAHFAARNSVGANNLPPVVDAGADQIVILTGAAVTLSGSQTDDGLPEGTTPSLQWQMVAGPSGGATILSPDQATTSVRFAQTGNYTFRLTANDSALSATDDVNVVVTNQMPAVSAGEDGFAVVDETSVYLVATATDDGTASGGTLTYAWTQTEGPSGGATITDPTSAASPVEFTAAGVYVFRVTVSDGFLSSEDTVQITVNPRPYRDSVIADNPVVFFEFEEPAGRTSVVDSVSGRTATLNNRGQKTGEAGLAQSSAISIAQHGVWRVEDSDNLIRRATGTWEVWIKFSANSAQEDIFEIGGGAHAAGLTVRGGGGVPFAIRTTSTSSVGPDAEVNRWYHLVVTHDGSDAKFYIDGQLQRTVTQTRTISSTQPVAIALPSKSTTARRFLDNFAVYSQVLGAAVISRHYADGSAVLEGGPNSSPTAAFTSSASARTVSFDGSSSSDSDGLIVKYAWNFGDGSSGTGAKPNHAYGADGAYPVTLVVTDNRGATATISQTVTVSLLAPNAPPTAVLSATADSGKAPLTVSFSANGSSDPDGTIASYAWDFGDGTTASGATASRTFPPGYHTVTLTVTDDRGGVATASKLIASTSFSDSPPLPLPAAVNPGSGVEGTIIIDDNHVSVSSIPAAVSRGVAASPTNFPTYGSTAVTVNGFNKAGSGQNVLSVAPTLAAGRYEVWVRLVCTQSNRAATSSSAVVKVLSGSTTKFFNVNPRQGAGRWVYYGTHQLGGQSGPSLAITNEGAFGLVQFDAAAFVPVTTPVPVLPAAYLPPAGNDFEKIVRAAAQPKPLEYASGMPVAPSVASQRQASHAARQAWDTLIRDQSAEHLWEDTNLGPAASGSKHFLWDAQRLCLMAKAWAGSTEVDENGLRGHPQLLADIHMGLDRFLTKRYGIADWGVNWYDYEIGVPEYLMTLLCVLGDNISPDLKSRSIAAMERFTVNPLIFYGVRSNFPSSGANRIWMVRNHILRAALKRDSTLLQTCRDGLTPVMEFTSQDAYSDSQTNKNVSRDGWYPDGSFIQHSHLPYVGAYGVLLIPDLMTCINFLEGTLWEVNHPSRANLGKWVDDHLLPVMAQGELLQRTTGRTQGSAGVETAYGWMLSALVELRPELSDAKRLELDRRIKSWMQNGAVHETIPRVNADQAEILTVLRNDQTLAAAEPYEGSFTFAGVDMAAHHRPAWSASVAMSSTRIYSHEALWGLNWRGWNQGEGVLQIWPNNPQRYRNGYWATVDPYRLPGITTNTWSLPDQDGGGSNPGSPTSQSFVGGASLGQLASVSAMRVGRAVSSLVARKSWFFLPNAVVCLGSGITATEERPTETIFEAALLDSMMTPIRVNNVSVASGEWSADLGAASTLHVGANQPAHSMGWWFPTPQNGLVASRTERTGNWANAMKAGANANFTRPWLSLVRSHGNAPNNSSYAYAIFPGVTPEALAAFAAAPTIEILIHTPEVHVVRDQANHLTGYVFWEAGSAAGLTVDRPCIVLVRESAEGRTFSITDPAQEMGTLKVTPSRAVGSPTTASPYVSVQNGTIIVALSQDRGVERVVHFTP